MNCKTKGVKYTVFCLLKEGNNIEVIHEITGIPVKIISIWKLQNEDFKKERLSILHKLLQYNESSQNPAFSKEEEILLNEEKTLLLNTEIITDMFQYPDSLKSKIELIVSKIKQ